MPQGLHDLPRLGCGRVEQHQRLGAGQGGQRLREGLGDDEFAAVGLAEALEELGLGEGEAGPVDDAHGKAGLSDFSAGR